MKERREHLKEGELAVVVKCRDSFNVGDVVKIITVFQDGFEEFVTVQISSGKILRDTYFSWRFESIITPKGNKKICVNQGVNVKSHV